MTTASANPGSVRAAKPVGQVVALAESDPLTRLKSPSLWVPLAVLGAAFVALAWRWILKQYQPALPLDWKFLEPMGGYSWQKPQDWGHSYIVPLISLFALYKDRHTLARRERSVFWPGLLVMVLGVVMYVFFIIGFSNHMFQGGALILCLSGLALLVFGPKVFGVLVFPLLYLLMAVTISEAVMNKVTYRLQDIAAQGAWVMLNMIGIDTDITGNVLTPHDSNGKALEPLNVAEACSGMRMVIAFMALGLAVGWLGCAFWWQRIALFLMGVPLAVFMNVVRVAVLGVLSLINPNLSTGEAHSFIGNILLIPSFLMFLGIMWVLKKVQPDPSASPVLAAATKNAPANRIGANPIGSKQAPAKSGGKS